MPTKARFNININATQTYCHGHGAFFFIYRTHGNIFIDNVTAINVPFAPNTQFIQMLVFVAQCLLFTSKTFGARIIGAFLFAAFIGIQIDFIVHISLDESRNLMINCC